MEAIFINQILLGRTTTLNGNIYTFINREINRNAPRNYQLLTQLKGYLYVH